MLLFIHSYHNDGLKNCFIFWQAFQYQRHNCLMLRKAVTSLLSSSSFSKRRPPRHLFTSVKRWKSLKNTWRSVIFRQNLYRVYFIFQQRETTRHHAREDGWPLRLSSWTFHLNVLKFRHQPSHRWLIRYITVHVFNFPKTCIWKYMLSISQISLYKQRQTHFYWAFKIAHWLKSSRRNVMKTYIKLIEN